jgi:hypothetical protein
MYEEKLRWSAELADRVKKDFDPYATIVAYTSGGDSNVALKLATMFFNVDAAFTCDTTIGAIETMMNCEKVATRHYGLKYISEAPRYGGISDNKNTYFEVVKRNGFPGKTSTAHSWMYKWLKAHTIEHICSLFRQRKRNRKIIIICGARRHESVRRMGTSQDITIMDSNVFVNICNDWTDSEMYAFSDDFNLQNLRSPISIGMGISGECFCGSYSSKGELNEIKYHSPSTFKKIMDITKFLNEETQFLWDWESGPVTQRDAKKAEKQKLKESQITLFNPNMLFCSTCMNNKEALIDIK